MQNDDQPTDSRGASQAAPDFAFAMLELKHLRQAMARHGDLLDQPVREFDIGERRFAFNSRRMLMGVINLSPDSAYRESVCRTPEEARARGMALIQAGADLVDIGAESSLPEADRVGPEAQIDRLRPVVKALCGQGAALSVESYYPEVLEACAQAGARVFNLTGSRDIPSVLALAARYQAAVIHCFVQGETVRQVVDYPPFETALDDVEAFLRTRLETAMAAGVTRNIIDPGLGFYYPNLTDGVSRVSLQMHTLTHAWRLRRLGWPVMNILPHAPIVFGEAHRRQAEPFFAVLALLGGSHILRTHEMEAVARVRAVMDTYRPELFPSAKS